MNDEWEVIEEGEPLEESYPEAGLRNVARTGSRILETLGGLPKTAVNIAEFLSKGAPLGGVLSPFMNKGFEIGEKVLPTSESIRQNVGKIAPEGYLEPQGSKEELSDEIFSDLASLMVPLGPIAGVKPLKALGIAGSSNLASYFAKERGYGEGTQKGVKLGTTLLTSLGLGDSLRNRAEKLYDTAKGSIKPFEKVDASAIQKTLKKVSSEFSGTGLKKAAGKEAVENIIDEVSTFIHEDKIGLNDLWQIKKDMRKAINLVDPRSEATIELSNITKALDSALKKSANKEFSSALTAADQIYSGVKRAEKINDFVKNVISNKFTKTGGVVSLLTNPIATLTSIVKAAPYAIPIGAAGTAGAHGLNAIYGIYKSPAIRNEYSAMIKAAAKENAPLVVKHAEKLNKTLNEIHPMFNEDEWEEV